MAWIYNVITKKFSRNGDYKFSAEYAGSPGYKDNPDDECVKNKGLLPRGNYHITGPIAVHPTAGRYVIRLTPHSGNSMCGREVFLIHGGNGRGTASNGCIILMRGYREKIIESGDKELIVQ